MIDAECESRLESCAGTKHFMAPEMELGCDYGQSADCFSFGITVCGMIAAQIPGQNGFLVRTPRSNFEFSVQEYRKSVPPDCPESFTELSIHCCAYEAEVTHLCSQLLFHVAYRCIIVLWLVDTIFCVIHVSLFLPYSGTAVCQRDL